MTDKLCRITFSKQVTHYQYIVIIRVRTQHVQVVLSTSTALAQQCARKVCLLALTSASFGASTPAPAGVSVIHFIFHCALATSQVHPKSAGLGNCWALIVAWPHRWPSSYPTLNTCWASASCVGGIFFDFIDLLSEKHQFFTLNGFQNCRDHTWWQLIS